MEGLCPQGESLLEGEGMLDPGWPVCLSEPHNPTLTGCYCIVLNIPKPYKWSTFSAWSQEWGVMAYLPSIGHSRHR